MTGLSEFTENLPVLRQWIDDLLLRHRSVAMRVDLLAFSRLKDYYTTETLRNTYVVQVDRVPIPPLTAMGLNEFADFERMDSDGITYRDLFSKA